MSTTRRALVTGATGSIGQAITKSLVEAGYEVTIQYFRNEARAQDLVQSMGVSAIKLDLCGEVELSDIRYDVLVNNAGINISSRLSGEVDTQDWAQTIAVNLTAPFLLVRQMLPYMCQQAYGRIVNISSIYGLRASEWNLPYNVSKHGLNGLTKTVAKEYASKGITCNEVNPGPVDSEMMHRIAEEETRGTARSAEDYLRSAAAEIPAQRLADPRDIAAAVAFLCSEEAAYINGVSLVVDGAWIA